ncbi:MAG TPA: hypothetical protein VHG92_05525 [Afifellaceae bacterium]|nr:hypothetical protein [Afifellaceae bacterium]
MNASAGGGYGIWFLIAGPTIWSAHFLASYVVAAVWCAKAAAPHGPVLLQWAIAAMTLLALAGIFSVGWVATREWRFGEPGWMRNDAPTVEARQRFVGHSSWLLCALSAVATIFVALPALLAPSCSG